MVSKFYIAFSLLHWLKDVEIAGIADVLWHERLKIGDLSSIQQEYQKIADANYIISSARCKKLKRMRTGKE